MSSRLGNAVDRLDDIEDMLNLTDQRIEDAYAWLEALNEQCRLSFAQGNDTSLRLDEAIAFLAPVSGTANARRTTSTPPKRC